MQTPSFTCGRDIDIESRKHCYLRSHDTWVKSWNLDGNHIISIVYFKRLSRIYHKPILSVSLLILETLTTTKRYECRMKSLCARQLRFFKTCSTIIELILWEGESRRRETFTKLFWSQHLKYNTWESFLWLRFGLLPHACSFIITTPFFP